MEDRTPPSETTHLLKSDSPYPAKQSFPREVLYFVKTSIPVFLSYSLQNSLVSLYLSPCERLGQRAEEPVQQTLSVVIVGHVGPAELSAAAFS